MISLRSSSTTLRNSKQLVQLAGVASSQLCDVCLLRHTCVSMSEHLEEHSLSATGAAAKEPTTHTESLPTKTADGNPQTDSQSTNTTDSKPQIATVNGTLSTSTPAEAIDRLKSICTGLHLSDVLFYTVPSHYYDLPLEQRADLLGGEQDVHTLCKTLLMTNSRYRYYTELSAEENAALNPQYVLVLIQYQDARLHNEKLSRCIWANIGQSNTHIKRNKHFNMRLASEEVNAEKTGYLYNSVAPIGCRDGSLRIVLSDRIARIPYFYCGAGHVDAKMRINTQDFIENCNVVVGDITHDQSKSTD